VKKKGIVLIILIGIIGAVIFNIGFKRAENLGSKGIQETENDTSLEFRTDIEPIDKIFPNLGEITECYWKADSFGSQIRGSNLLPGPTDYWMKGFLIINENNLNEFKDKYYWTLVEEDKKPDLETEFLETGLLDINSFEWYYSEEFNNYVKQPGYHGGFYVDFDNGIIYFDFVRG
jgi:hypothetical protein